ncbi:transcriptional regulator [Azospirillum palustre]|uniref:Transcriptional regulator n=2 Tax=Azospirillum palustre TaxID=2044885 RepID=A0A2B8BFK6_9PROT|nr:transcriptional regulator [Azospirillum palustre]
MGTERDAMKSGTSAAAARFLRTAKLCRIRDVEQLLAVSALVRDLSALIHALQKERGASSIYLGSGGTRFAEDRARWQADARTLESVLRDRLDLVDEQLDRLSCGAQFYSRAAIALYALDGLPALRDQVSSLALVPQDSVKAFTDIVGHLLSVLFEAADIAADPAISRALVALFNVVQGKEFAGQERATASAGFSRGRFDGVEHGRLAHLIDAQNRAFRIFAEFADPAHAAAFRTALADPAVAEVERMRAVALSDDARHGELSGITPEIWFDRSTRRMELLKTVEDRLTDDLRRLCEAKLAQARADLGRADAGGPDAVLPVAMMLVDAVPAMSGLAGAGVNGPSSNGQGQDGAGLYAPDGLPPKLMRSVLDVMQAQSQRLRDVSLELETAKAALNERKVIDRAKGLLMSTRNLSEEEAYKLIRKTAMNQNKRIVEVAEAILSMSDILRGVTAPGGTAGGA